MKKIVGLMLSLALAFLCTSCSAPDEEKPLNMEPQATQMKAICELAVMDCYYHNVAKFTEEDAQGILLWKKDKRFWIEYSGVVKLGIDVSLVNVEIKDTQVTITLPEAKVLGCKVDSTSLTEDSFIVDQNSGDIGAADEVKAFKAAQSKLEEMAASDKALLASAQQRAQDLLTGYMPTSEPLSEKTTTSNGFMWMPKEIRAASPRPGQTRKQRPKPPNNLILFP